jgi:hypothetical protein
MTEKELLNELNRITKERDNWKALVCSWCEEEEIIKNMARPHLPPELVDGSKYGVPGSLGIVENLCNRIKELESVIGSEIKKATP